jgi:peptidoglycan/xylan/chitin deacetylase (PgdA/CDA1 family)
MHHFLAFCARRVYRSTLLATVCVACAASAHAAAPVPAPAFAWPGGARAAVSLAYDDALDSQLDNALPALDRHGIKGTFYLQLSSPPVAARLPAWRAAAARGHELGNHSLFHQCSSKGQDRGWVAAHRDLATTGRAQMIDQVLLANTMLEAIDSRRERTYTAPCGDVQALDGDYLPALHPAFVAIKAGNGPGVPASMAAVDPYQVASVGPVGASGAELIALVEQAIARGTMVAFTFHGIGGDHLSVSTQAHEELVRYLAAHRDVVWTDTFINIMQHVRQEQARLSGWTLEWSDEFNGAALDRTIWALETGGHGWGNNEMQFYTARPENVRVEDGHLVIEARKERYEGKDYTSARLKTAGLKETQYGRFEARIKVPKGQGIWPAFWMLGADIGKVGWPQSGEIDIMEIIGKEPRNAYGTLHGPGYSGEHAFSKPIALDGADYGDDFHVFAVEWEPQAIRWYRDGVHYHTATPALVKGDWVFEHPFFVLLNLAVGGYWPGYPDSTTAFPRRMLVDYVRVYRRDVTGSAQRQ